MPRHFRQLAILASLALGWIAAVSQSGISYGGPPARLFPTDAPGKTWLAFPAEGFPKGACGLVYRLGDTVECGVPLGGIDTGCIDLETSGLLGYNTIFNTHVPRGGPINLPVLGISAGGKAWVLCAKRPKPGWPKNDWGVDERMVLPVRSELKLDGAATAKEVHYWGHYPVADLEFDTDAPVQVGLRAWTPFLPGDVKTSMMPAMVFEVHLRNPGGAEQTGTIAFSFPGPDPNEAGTSRFERRSIGGGLAGVEVTGKLASYAIAALDADNARLGGELGADGQAWAKIAASLPEVRDDRAGASVAVDFSLPAGQEKVVRFVATWCAPTWNGVGYNWATKVPKGYSGSPRTFTHMYAKYYPSPAETARRIQRDHDELLRRVLAWQQVVYAESSLPVWLRDSLVNVLHLITEDGLWAQARPPIPGWSKENDGLYGMIECPRECPQIECIPCSFYGTLPLAYFFPELALSTLRGYKGYQFPEGAVPWIFGGCTETSPYIEFAMPHRGYQITLNGPCYVAMVDRYLMCHDSRELLDEFYPSVKKAVAYTIGLNRGPDGVASMPDHMVSTSGFNWETEWFEFVHWGGIVPHVGGIHLAMLEMAERMAERTGDRAFAEQCREWIAQGQKSLNTKMWNGNSYLTLWDEKAGKKSDLVFANQLDGEWIARFHGLPGVFPPDRVRTALKTIENLNMTASPYGAISFIRPDKTVLRERDFPLASFYHPYDFFMPEVMMLGMTYMYDGQGKLGMELVRRSMDNVVRKQGSQWYMPCIVLGDTGKRSSGSDYYQNMMLWSLPAAAKGQSLDTVCRSAGLVDRMIQAAAGRGSR